MKRGRQAIAELMAMAHSFSCDKSGRINLNDKLISFAEIKKGAVLLGTLSTFSIYSEEVYEAMSTKAPSDPAKRAEVFKRFGL